MDYIEPFDMDDDEAQEPEPLPKGTQAQVEIRGGGANAEYGLVSVYLRVIDDEWQGYFISPYTLNSYSADDEDWKRKSAKRSIRRFAEGFGVEIKDVIAVMNDALEAVSNSEDPGEAFESLIGKTASIISTIDKKDRPVVSRFTVNKLA